MVAIVGPRRAEPAHHLDRTPHQAPPPVDLRPGLAAGWFLDSQHGTLTAILRDMSRTTAKRSDSAFRTLTADQRRTWLAYMRVQLRLTYEMNRQLQADSNLSLPDYDVLNALRYASGVWGAFMQIVRLSRRNPLAVQTPATAILPW